MSEYTELSEKFEKITLRSMQLSKCLRIFDEGKIDKRKPQSYGGFDGSYTYGFSGGRFSMILVTTRDGKTFRERLNPVKEFESLCKELVSTSRRLHSLRDDALTKEAYASELVRNVDSELRTVIQERDRAVEAEKALRNEVTQLKSELDANRRRTEQKPTDTIEVRMRPKVDHETTVIDELYESRVRARTPMRLGLLVVIVIFAVLVGKFHFYPKYLNYQNMKELYGEKGLELFNYDLLWWISPESSILDK